MIKFRGPDQTAIQSGLCPGILAIGLIVSHISIKSHQQYLTMIFTKNHARDKILSTKFFIISEQKLYINQFEIFIECIK